MGNDAPGRVALQVFAEGDSLDFGIAPQQPVQRVQEGPGVLAIGAPGVLAIQHDCEHSVLVSCDLPGEALLDLAREILCRLLVVGVAVVVEANGVGDLRVSEEDADRTFSLLGAIELAQDIRIIHVVAPAP